MPNDPIPAREALRREQAAYRRGACDRARYEWGEVRAGYDVGATREGA